MASDIDVDESMTDEERTELRSHRSVCLSFVGCSLARVKYSFDFGHSLFQSQGSQVVPVVGVILLLAVMTGGASVNPQRATSHCAMESLLSSNRHYLSYDDCREDKSENYQNCSALCCVRQLCTMIRLHTYEQFLQLTVCIR